MLRQLLNIFITMNVNREGVSRCTELPGLLLSYTRQVAFGMVRLQMKQFIHRDLAARNVLVFEDGLCKVRIHIMLYTLYGVREINTCMYAAIDIVWSMRVMVGLK